MKKWGMSLIAIGAVVSFLSPADAATSTGPLDGKIFSGEVGKQGKTKGDKDQFVFKAGTFRSTACDSYGFKETAYSTAQAGNQLTFEAKAESQTDGTMLWKGAVQGGHISGMATWTKSGKEEQYWFAGDLTR